MAATYSGYSALDIYTGRTDLKVMVNFWHAYDKFRRFRRLPRNQNSERQFLKFLGSDEKASHITDEIIFKIEWMCGPHAHAMFRAWEAQND